MSEEQNRSEETGQFTPSLEGLYGSDYENVKAGYIPYKDPEAEQAKADSEEPTVRDIAEQLAERRREAEEAARGPESAIKTYSPLDEGLPENTSFTLEQTVERLGERRRAMEEQVQEAENERVRRRQDELRGASPEAGTNSAPEPAAVSEEDADLDPDAYVQKLSPKMREAVAGQIAQSHAAEQQHLQAVTAATEIAKEAIVSKYPALKQIMSLPADQQDGAVQALMQREPQLAAQLAADFERTNNLFEQRRIAEQRQAETKTRELQDYAKAESAKFEASIKDVPADQRRAIEASIAEAITEAGGDINQFAKLLRGSEFASATAQNLLWELGKSRMRLKAIDNAKLVHAKRNVPTVQRPGAGVPRLTVAESSIAAAKAAADRNPTIKNLAAYLTARRKAAGG